MAVMVGDSLADEVWKARHVLDLHIRVCVPESVCQRCLKVWPCAEARWANEILRRYHMDGGSSGADLTG
jgi:hypothetical protein